MNMIAHFFGDASNVQAKLVSALQRHREEMNLKRVEVDRVCHLGRDERYPTCGQFESNPTLLTAEAFTLAAAALRVDVDDVLEVDLSDPQTLHAVLADMHEEDADVVAAVGADVCQIAESDKARAYVLFKIMHELQRLRQA